MVQNQVSASLWWSSYCLNVLAKPLSTSSGKGVTSGRIQAYIGYEVSFASISQYLDEQVIEKWS